MDWKIDFNDGPIRDSWAVRLFHLTCKYNYYNDILSNNEDISVFSDERKCCASCEECPDVKILNAYALACVMNGDKYFLASDLYKELIPND